MPGDPEVTILAIDPGTIRLGYCAIVPRSSAAQPPYPFLSDRAKIVELGAINAPAKHGRLDRLLSIRNGLRARSLTA
jgi:Holliday junction resolvasome RuvABC endonuclease subunit